MINPHLVEHHQLNEQLIDIFVGTLVKNRRLRSRGGFAYLTSRSWRAPMKEMQISTIKAIKKFDVQPLAKVAAIDVIDVVHTLLGTFEFSCVINVPCSHSSPENCLSCAIGSEAAKLLGIPKTSALSADHRTGSSHPIGNATRAPMQLKAPVGGTVLVVDDIATSGSHIAEASGLLRAVGVSVVAVAWIGGIQ
jgi:predicted amidophosphoribosyltransferase